MFKDIKGKTLSLEEIVVNETTKKTHKDEDMMTDACSKFGSI